MKPAESSQNIDLNGLFISRVESTNIEEASYSNLDLCLAFEKSVPGSILRKLVKSIPRQLLMASLGSSTEDYSKLVRRKFLTVNQTDSLNELTKAGAELRQLFCWKQEVLEEWIEQKLPTLGGAKVRQLIVTNSGRIVIRELIDEMRSGEFA
ncbi:hypothetical protein [Idiomarina piscisalsi]|uniref:hypothetical protein n=1 Tax=Idiomarina piscisalsi TaxID=1096243 RepID=UPI001384C84A|nr:hypothetical protein [Idiomarina piscisalsi]MTJ02677.1 hypothetical protein [Idiomarina piscisalsi]